jgi:hypothetical protein
LIFHRPIRELEDLIRARVEFYRDAGAGFFYIKMFGPELTKRLLDLSLCRFSMGTALLHCWVPTFNPLRLVGFFDPIWITLRFLALEYLDSVREVAGMVGTVIAEDPRYSVFNKSHFCIATNPAIDLI